jgi:hypothetical protein
LCGQVIVFPTKILMPVRDGLLSLPTRKQSTSTKIVDGLEESPVYVGTAIFITLTET